MMRRVTISMQTLLWAVVVLAVDMAGITTILSGRPPLWSLWTPGMMVVLPGLNVLVIGLMVFLERYRRRGGTGTFLPGFEVAGFTVLLLLFMAYLADFRHVGDYRRWTNALCWEFWHAYIEWTGGLTIEFADAITMGFGLLAFTVPVLAAALVGGFTTRALGLNVVRSNDAAAGLRGMTLSRTRPFLLALALLLGAGTWAAWVRGRWEEWQVFDVSGSKERRTREDYARTLAQMEEMAQQGQNAMNTGYMKDQARYYARSLEWYAATRKLYDSTSAVRWLFLPPEYPRQY